LGKETISMYTESRTRGQSPSYGQNLQRLGKELMTMDELTTMDGNRCILQLRGLGPFFSPKYDLRKHPNFKYTLEADKKNAFDIEASAAICSAHSPAAAYERMEQHCRLCRALNSLPEKQGRRIEAHYLLGHSQTEIAEAEGVSIASVNIAIQRGLDAMKKYLKNYC